MTTSTYTVTGMTCEHCVSSITSELTELGTLSDVRVELPTGQLTVTSEGPIDDAAIRAAVDEAGYEIVG
ncbi:MAG TPA: heavy-metal-associated domain-containing protein [Mycobacteriales bacterium]|jgi:copper chaperone CopZ|nr:heavy-metal-associated domain-containing protein [Mycobacteriales bacterium]